MDDIVKRSIESETRRSDAGFMNRRAMAPSSLTRSLLILAGLSLAVAALYLARGVLMPLALAVLLTFLVHPIVGWLGRRGIGRVPSVILVVVMLFAVLGGVAWVLILQFGSLRSEIPGYRDNLIQKISLVRGLGKGGALEQAQTAVHSETLAQRAFLQELLDALHR